MNKILPLLFLFATMAYADNESHWRKAEELIQLSPTGKLVEDMVQKLEGLLEQQVISMHQSLTTEYLMPSEINKHLDIYEKKAKEVLHEKLSKESFYMELIPMYMANFSEAELDQILEFHRSPIGKIVNERMPLVLTQSEEIGAELSRAYFQEIQKLNIELGKTIGLESTSIAQ